MGLVTKLCILKLFFPFRILFYFKMLQFEPNIIDAQRLVHEAVQTFVSERLVVKAGKAEPGVKFLATNN